MPSAAVDAAIMTRLSTDWTTSPVIGLNGVTEPPTDENAFLVVQYPIVISSKPVLRGRYFEDGAARLVLNVRAGLSLDTVLPWADELAGLFRDYKSPTVSGFETFTPSAPIINDASDDGNWFELAVIVPYRYQFS
jgi:hypothetical protein